MEQKKDSVGNAAGTGVVATIRGKEYTIRPLTVRDLGEFEGWVKGKRLKALMTVAGQLDSGERCKLIHDVAVAQVETRDLIAEMESLEGVTFLLWRVLRRSHADLTLEQAGDLVGMDNFREIKALVDAISGADESDPPTAGADRPANASAGTS